ncbi:uncharacterized protein MONBRDRAFT_28496 [Monosiga brevicollis MX1]|uniref:Uncharacterized protein n=1 Tax=Monosiga brevicollis TaxID=81824 RepID=A9V8C0_MONBE|nr:uncharacterized protein MONBRDRAFT_28496 [Monosiga brevicollis MX1]EDQ86311.1 predicted protein [Monosiga brevicollis MX1]|eukprot:XP_001748981.1 hypothetical protein [Monosiga brevicollis MX1]
MPTATRNTIETTTKNAGSFTSHGQPAKAHTLPSRDTLPERVPTDTHTHAHREREREREREENINNTTLCDDRQQPKPRQPPPVHTAHIPLHPPPNNLNQTPTQTPTP